GDFRRRSGSAGARSRRGRAAVSPSRRGHGAGRPPHHSRHVDRARLWRDPSEELDAFVIVIGGEALVDLVEDDGSLRAVAGGGPFNTAIAFGRLDVAVGFLGAISRDAYGQMLAQQLADAGVDTSLVNWSDAPTARAVVHRHRDGKHE